MYNFKSKYLFYFLIIIYGLTISSCIKDVDYKLDFEGSKMVVFAGGVAGQKLSTQITRTIAPLTKVDNPDSLVVSDALIEIVKNNDVVDTMISQGEGKYISHITLQENNVYKIKINSEGELLESGYDTVPVPALINSIKITEFSEEKDTTNSYDFTFMYKIQIYKSVQFPYNDISLTLFANGKEYEDYVFLSSKNEFVECDNCFNLLDNPCTKYLGNNIYEITNEKTVYSPEYKLKDLDSIQFILNTYSSLSDRLCQSGMDLEEYYGNPLPFVSNPSVMFSNIEGGYGIFLLGASDSLTIKL